jgi:hypothetical protein
VFTTVITATREKANDVEFLRGDEEMVAPTGFEPVFESGHVFANARG